MTTEEAKERFKQANQTIHQVEGFKISPIAHGNLTLFSRYIQHHNKPRRITMFCDTHKRKISYTCPICETEYEYSSRTHLLQFFRAGVLNKEIQTNDTQEKAAYQHGLSFYKQPKNKRTKETTNQGESPMAKKTTTTPPISFDTMLNQTVVPSSDGSKKKKDQLPIINLDTNLTKKLHTFINKKTEMKAAEGEMRLAETPIIESCLKRMDKDALTADFHSSYEVKGDDGTSIKFITIDKFNLSQEPENIQALHDLLGDKFDNEIIKTPTVTLKTDVFQNPTLQKELAEIMGTNFAKFFETSIKYSTKPGFDERLYKIAKTQTDVFNLRTLCGKNKPFFK